MFEPPANGPAHLPTPFRILGLDPGLQITGYGVLEISSPGPIVIEAGVIKPGADAKSPDLASRLARLYDELVELIETHRPSAVAVEQLYAHYKHPRTAILMGHARGVLLLVAAQQRLTLTSHSATAIKKTITGHGHANKVQMQAAIQRELNLKTRPEPADVADALAVALCQYYARKRA